MSSNRIRLPHIGALDGLRGAAVAGVVFFHGGYLTGGYLGVDLFFVLSGYLITSLLLTEWHTNGRIALSAFWARRARRLLPALVLVIAAVAIYSRVFAASTELGRIRGDALATLGYVANWRAIFLQQSYFEILQSVPSPLDHTWSLAIEEQFYVFWPLIVVGLAAWWKRHLSEAVLVTAVLLGTISTVLMVLLWNPNNINRVYYGTDTRSFALFAGIAIAAYVQLWGHPRGRARVSLEVGGIAALALLAWMWISLDGQSARLYHGGFFGAGIAAAILIAVAANPERGPISWVLSFPPLRWLGLISYGLYLWHWPVDVVLNPERVGLTGWPLFLIRTAVALAIAIASYYLLEMPIRRGAFRPTQWRIAIPVVATVLVVATIVTTLGATNAVAILEDKYFPHPNARVLLVGDSVAQSLAPGMDRATPNFGLLWSPGCRLIHGKLTFGNPNGGDCAWEQMWQPIINRLHPEYALVLIGTWDLFDVQLPGTHKPVSPGTPQWNQAFRDQLARLARMLGRNRTKVVLLTIPCASHGIISGPAKEFLNGAFDINRVNAANAVIRDVGATSAGKIRVVDLNAILCPGGRFAGVIDGVTMRTDGVHLSDAGSDIVTRWLLPQLALHDQRPSTSTTAPPPPSN